MRGIRGTSKARRLALAALGAAALAIAACGADDGEIPSGEASELLATLEGIESDARDGFCDEAQQGAAELAERIDGLGNGVDGELREALREGTRNLDSLVADRCEDEAATDPTEPLPTETEEPETDTTTTETDTETTTEDDDDGDGGNGGDGEGDGGNGGGEGGDNQGPGNQGQGNEGQGNQDQGGEGDDQGGGETGQGGGEGQGGGTGGTEPEG